MTRTPVLLTTGKVAAVLGVDAATVRRWISGGKLAAVRLPSGQSRITQDTLDEILRARLTEQPAAEAVSA
jgi:excisionase family DNA binding protein